MVTRFKNEKLIEAIVKIYDEHNTLLDFDIYAANKNRKDCGQTVEWMFIAHHDRHMHYTSARMIRMFSQNYHRVLTLANRVQHSDPVLVEVE